MNRFMKLRVKDPELGNTTGGPRNADKGYITHINCHNVNSFNTYDGLDGYTYTRIVMQAGAILFATMPTHAFAELLEGHLV